MRTIAWLAVVTSCLTPLCGPLAGQSRPGTETRPVPNPIEPPPNFRGAIANATRTTSGTPGPEYWQQWANYTLHARLEPASKTVRGRARIQYFNHSPDTLDLLFVHLHQNVHAGGAVRNRTAETTGGVQLERVAAQRTALQEGRDYEVQGTVMALRPPRPLAPSQSAELEIDWSFVVPQEGLGRMGWSRDDLFFIAYWYPQMAVYDDVNGWHLDPYLGNAEFYAGYGNYDMTVEAPAQWLVLGTGSLGNADDVLSAPVRERLRRAEESDDVVHVVTADDLMSGQVTAAGTDSWLTWRFRADSVRDVSFSVTRESLWDARRTPVGDRNDDGATDYTRIDALYRQSAPLWRETARYAAHSIDFLSRFTGIPYPWPHMSVIEGAEIINGGMEFPMMTLIGDYNERGDSALYYVNAHELAHMWVPMIVGIDERRRAWMDEGTTTFNENQARKEFYPGINHDLPDQESYLSVARAGVEGEMMRWTDYHYLDAARGIASYSKPATLLVALRGLLGEETFLAAYRAYLAAWRYKHPQPWDFFNAMERGAGRDLDWFWRSWYYETWQLDQAISNVVESQDSVTITINDLGEVPMPVRLAVTLDDGQIVHREIPVDHWLQGARTASITIPTGGRVLRIEIDPERVFPDVDRGNNLWTRRE